MRQYVPSEVVGYIDQALSFVPKDDLGHGQSFHVSRGIRTALLGLVEITDRVPEHLIIDSAALTDIICGVQAIRTVVREAETQDFRSQLSGLAATLEPIAPNQWNPVILIRRAFARCPDDAPGPHVERLPFISDDLLRRSLETDLDAIDRAHAGREWKAILHGEAVVQAPVVGYPLQRAGARQVREAVECVGHKPIGNVPLRVAVIGARVAVRVIPHLRGALGIRALGEV